ncbi:MAG: hydroxymethylpyrimidine kinase/phosphomethylpyrimidine kinase [Verrucomicrobiales bacterium]|jgi:hydroxymethylpyrimidine kinase/phosphomethylpyrimidine kinase
MGEFWTGANVSKDETPPVALTIAGTDSGGNAGLAADLKTFAAHRVHGVFAVTVVTAQNTTGIVSAVPMERSLIEAQIDATLDDFIIGATKTGLLFSPQAVASVAERADRLGPLVVDPVLVTSQGKPMLSPEMASRYIEQLFPHAVVITPNVAEAALLTGVTVDDRVSAARAAEALLSFGPKAVVVTGLLEPSHAVDVVATESGTKTMEHERVDTINVLGTGCSLAAAVTARLCREESVEQAIAGAAEFVLEGLRSGSRWRLGEGRGPIDHFVSPDREA